MAISADQVTLSNFRPKASAHPITPTCSQVVNVIQLDLTGPMVKIHLGVMEVIAAIDAGVFLFKSSYLSNIGAGNESGGILCSPVLVWVLDLP
jgi:hypothetical protein